VNVRKTNSGTGWRNKKGAVNKNGKKRRVGWGGGKAGRDCDELGRPGDEGGNTTMFKKSTVLREGEQTKKNGEKKGEPGLQLGVHGKKQGGELWEWGRTEL